MDETEFHQRVDDILASIESQADAFEDDIDCEVSSGILTLEFASGRKVIINRQTPNREIWVAAKSGGFHFRFDAGAWRDTRSNQTLDTLLTKVCSEQSGSDVVFSFAG
ncbi:MAG: iron donor protein CyaY [Burkholderiales bacterium]|nr:iron donor protein CyaY [Nitrosomonadaceae bacterium]